MTFLVAASTGTAMAVTDVLASATAAAASVAAVLALTAAAGALAASCPSTLYLYQPQCAWNYVNSSYTSCECTDTPCGFYRYRFLQNPTDRRRAYLYAWTGCRGKATLLKHTTGGCDIFNFRSVRVCLPCTGAKSLPPGSSAGDDDQDHCAAAAAAAGSHPTDDKQQHCLGNRD